jgi:hypothetical protein
MFNIKIEKIHCMTGERNNITNKVHLSHKVFICNPTCFSITAIFRDNTNMVGKFSRPLHNKLNKKSKQEEYKTY